MLNNALISSTHCHFPYLSVFQCFREGAQPFVQNYRLLPGVSMQLWVGVGVGQILPTPALTPVKTVYCDGLKLLFRIRLHSPGGGGGRRCIGTAAKFSHLPHNGRRLPVPSRSVQSRPPSAYCSDHRVRYRPCAEFLPPWVPVYKL